MVPPVRRSASLTSNSKSARIELSANCDLMLLQGAWTGVRGESDLRQVQVW
jgi:hypothetical protein